MKKALLTLFILMLALFLTGCTITSSRYEPAPSFNRSYVSSTGYGVGDYGLGFGTDYSPQNGLVDYDSEH